MKAQIHTKYCNEIVSFHWRQYPSKQHALTLHGQHGPEMTVTVNMPDHKIEFDEIVVKNYSGNEGILSELVRLEIIDISFRVIRSGYVELQVCKLLIDPTLP